MSSSRDMAVANFMPQCADFVFICVLTGFLQTAIKYRVHTGPVKQIQSTKQYKSTIRDISIISN